MARSIRTRRPRVVPDVPYYGGELPAVGVRTTTTSMTEEVDDNRNLLWLLLIPVILLLVFCAYLLGRDDSPQDVAPSPSPGPVTTSVLVVPGQAPPPVIVNQPPPVVVTQPPAVVVTQPAPSPTTS